MFSKKNSSVQSALQAVGSFEAIRWMRVNAMVSTIAETENERQTRNHRGWKETKKWFDSSHSRSYQPVQHSTPWTCFCYNFSTTNSTVFILSRQTSAWRYDYTVTDTTSENRQYIAIISSNPSLMHLLASITPTTLATMYLKEKSNSHLEVTVYINHSATGSTL